MQRGIKTQMCHHEVSRPGGCKNLHEQRLEPVITLPFRDCVSSTLERVKTARSAQHARHLEGPDETRVSLPRCR